MKYLLRLHFDPEFDHTKRQPQENEDGSVDHYELNYVQSVRKGDLLAEWEHVEEEDAAAASERGFFSDTRDFPMGDNVKVHPDSADKLIADANGFVFLKDGLVTVKKVLNVRGDVDFKVGNIEFFNNVVVHGSVRSGFEVAGRNIHVHDTIEQAQLTAEESILCDCGVKGSKGARLEAKKSIRVGFCEFCTMRAGKNIIVDGACLHSKLYARNGVVIKGRFTGGRAVCYHYFLVEGKLGGGLNADTEIILGYDPQLIFKDYRLSRRLKKLREHIIYLKIQIAKELNDAILLKLNEELEEMRILEAKNLHARHVLTNKIVASEDLDKCKILVPDRVEAGVEISIGQAWHKVEEPLENVYFYFEDNEIKYASPAIME